MTSFTPVAPLTAQEDLDKERREAGALAQAFSAASTTDRTWLARIVDLLPCYVTLINAEHRILFYNKAFEEYFGLPDTRPCYAALRGKSAPCKFCPSPHSMTAKGSTTVEWMHPSTGHVFRVYSYPFNDADGTACVLEAGFNVTANVRVQQALDLSEQSYRAITDNLSIGIALITPELRIKTGNIRLSQWFAEGFRLDRLVCELLHCGQFWERATVEPGFTCPDCPFMAALRDGASHEKELEVTFQDGAERIIRLVTCPVTSTPSRVNKPKIRALIMMLEDITNRIKVNQQLQRARKLEAMSTLAGGIAHEINQPLSALHLYASGMQMLLEKQQCLPADTTKERLGLIMREADKIRSIISHMRALVMQDEHVPPKAVSLPGVVENVLALMKHQVAAREVSMRVEMPKHLPMVISNDLQLEQVLVNLLANALHALDSPETKQGKSRRSILIRASRTGDAMVRLEVADSGSGLSKSSEHIFDPFFTTKERHEGMGLGLSIVYSLVSLWGGEITVIPHHPELGGASFAVDLPIAEPEDSQGREEGKTGTIYQFFTGASTADPLTRLERELVAQQSLSAKTPRLTDKSNSWSDSSSSVIKIRKGSRNT